MLLWATIYWVLPDVTRKFRLITPGSVVGVLVWLLASWGFSEYVVHFPRSQAAYGALGGVVVLLLWMWISAQALLVGAEINAVIDHAPERGDLSASSS
jgi:membrane protein